MAKSNSEKIVLYELWRNILIVLKTHCVIWNSLTPLPPTPASSIESYWMTVVTLAWFRLIVFQCASPEIVLGRITYYDMILYQYWTKYELKERTKCSSVYYSHSVNRKQDSSRLTLASFSFFLIIIWSWKDKYLNRLSRFLTKPYPIQDHSGQL